MPQKFKRKISHFLWRLKFPLCLILIVFFLLLFKTKIIQLSWWSILFTNPLKQENNLTNILLLGVAGGEHEGADLTDTIIIVSFNQKKKTVSLISLPRDLWSPALVAKINTAYHYGEEKEQGGGFKLAKDMVKEVTDLPIHYFVKIDFAGFQKLIDLLGGVEVEIEREFDDYYFPIAGRENDNCGGDPGLKCRYQHVHFKAGRQILNGEQALWYVRSRNAEGEEGTDFARIKRQQKLLLALKNKILSPRILVNLSKTKKLITTLLAITETNITYNELPFFIRLVLKSNFASPKVISLEKFLTTPPLWQYGQWVLIPKSGDFQEIKNFLKEQILE